MATDRNTRLDGRVLLADDHAVLRMGLAETVRKRLGATSVIEAEGYKDALEALLTQPVSLAIIDLGMPGLTDPQTQLLHLRRQYPDMKLVVYTGSQDRDHILAALHAGIHGYILKSDGVELLIKRLEYVLAGEIYVPPLLAEPPPAGKVSQTAQPAPANGTAEPVKRYKLSARQLQVLKCLVDGRSNKQIARDLDLAESTVKMHVGAVFRTLGVNNRAKAAAIGQRMLDAQQD